MFRTSGRAHQEARAKASEVRRATAMSEFAMMEHAAKVETTKQRIMHLNIRIVKLREESERVNREEQRLCGEMDKLVETLTDALWRRAVDGKEPWSTVIDYVFGPADTANNSLQHSPDRRFVRVYPRRGMASMQVVCNLERQCIIECGRQSEILKFHECPASTWMRLIQAACVDRGVSSESVEDQPDPKTPETASAVNEVPLV